MPLALNVVLNLSNASSLHGGAWKQTFRLLGDSNTKKCYFAIVFYFLVRVFRNVLIPSVRMMLTMSNIFARIICQTIEWEVNYSTAKKKYVILASIFYYILVRRLVQFSHSCFFCIRRYSPYCKPVKPGHYSVLRPRILRVLLTLYGKMT